MFIVFIPEVKTLKKIEYQLCLFIWLVLTIMKFTKFKFIDKIYNVKFHLFTFFFVKKHFSYFLSTPPCIVQCTVCTEWRLHNIGMNQIPQIYCLQKKWP